MVYIKVYITNKREGKYMFKNTENLQAFVVNCAFIYSEKEWEKIVEENSSMQPCHDVLMVEGK